MASFPFYITPNEFSKLQQELTQDIATSSDSLSWSTYNLEEENRWLRKQLWLAASTAVTVFLVGIGMVANFSDFTYLSSIVWIYIISLSIGAFATYVSFAVDDFFDYHLSSKGISISKRVGEPKWVPRATKAMGVIGSVSCVALVAVMGPSALVGAGGFMLLSFTLLNRKPHEPDLKVVPAEDFMCARYDKKRNIVCIFSKIDVCRPSESEKHEGKILRSLAKTRLYIFPESAERYEQVLSLVENELDLECKPENDLGVMFDWKKAPQEFKAFRHQREHYSMEDAVAKRDHPAPPPKKPR
ncbi:hypothetical protein [Vibrio coralliilyticus]|uniref:hypothetical protein n=1 Tax=Vibrio coralliilyticus TaxID=190893 RepID=UPI00155F9130|nr:hypothetical protein [Vibrio coralliilyticus]NRF13645.1 hypothetical protein [Vibrio coralliilyticus]